MSPRHTTVPATPLATLNMLCRRCGVEVGVSADQCSSCLTPVLVPSPVATPMLPDPSTENPNPVESAPAENSAETRLASVSDVVVASGVRLAAGNASRRRPPRCARRSVRQPLPHHPGTGCRRHGRRVSGVGRGLRGDGRAQSDSPGGHQRSLHGAAKLSVGSSASCCWLGEVTSPQRRSHPRSRRDQRHQVHHDVVRGRPRPG